MSVDATKAEGAVAMAPPAAAAGAAGATAAAREQPGRQGSGGSAGAGVGGHDLDALARMSFSELAAIYRGAEPPACVAALNGSREGRLLALAGGLGRGAAARWLRMLAASPLFPWRGKSFRAWGDGAGAGAGINRVRLLVPTVKIATFETRIAASVLDGRPCAVLDYDRPDNPWPLRRLRDELRRIGPELYLGPAMLRLRSGPRPVLYFAVSG